MTRTCSQRRTTVREGALHVPAMTGLTPIPRCRECHTSLPLNYLCEFCEWMLIEDAEGNKGEICVTECAIHARAH